jgi:hypothetical protein
MIRKCEKCYLICGLKCCPNRRSLSRGAAAMGRSLDAQRLDPSPRRGEGGGRFGYQVRVLTQRAQRAIQKISAFLSDNACGIHRVHRGPAFGRLRFVRFPAVRVSTWRHKKLCRSLAPHNTAFLQILMFDRGVTKHVDQQGTMGRATPSAFMSSRIAVNAGGTARAKAGRPRPMKPWRVREPVRRR